MKKTTKDRYVILGLSLLSAFIFIIIYAFMMVGKDGYIYLGHDMMFHKARLDGLYQAFQNGVWFPKINYLNVDGSGYASSIFYNEILLYPTALLRFIGLDSYSTYQLSLFLWNTLTFLMSFYAMKPILKDKKKQILFAFLYVLSPYRIFDVFIRGALGEIIALAFIPVALNGMYQIIYGKPKKWWVLTIGMLGIIHSHLLTTFLFSVMILLFVIIEWKTVLRVKERLLSFVKATVLTICCSLWYLLPMFEQMAFQELKVAGSPRYMVGDGTHSLPVMIIKNIMGSPTETNLGVLSLIVMFWYLIHQKKVTSRFLKVSTFVSVILFIGTSTVIPWKQLETTPLNAIQFPWRFYIVINLLTLLLYSSGEIKVLKGIGSKTVLVLSTLYSVGIFFTSFYILDATVGEKFYTLDVFNAEVKDIGAGKEYLPINFEYDYYIPNLSVPDYNKELGEVSDFERNYDKAQLEYSFSSPTEVTIPLTYYKGYEAVVNGKPAPLFESTEHPGRIATTLNGGGTLTIQYKNTTVQNLSAIASIIFAMGFILVVYREEGLKIPSLKGLKNRNPLETI